MMQFGSPASKLTRSNLLFDYCETGMPFAHGARCATLVGCLEFSAFARWGMR